MNREKHEPHWPDRRRQDPAKNSSISSLCFGVILFELTEQARRLIATYVNHYNTVRLHSAIGYITPQDKLLGKEKAIFAARDQKLAQARRQRKIKRQNQPAHSLVPQPDFSN